MPKKSLAVNEVYTVNARLTIGDETVPLNWKFTTRRNNRYLIKADPPAGSMYTLDFAHGRLINGDSLLFDEGTHVLKETQWIMKDITIAGRGRDKTIFTGLVDAHALPGFPGY